MFISSPSHDEFRAGLDRFIQLLSPDQRSRLTKDSTLRTAVAKIRKINLDPLDEILKPLFSNRGRAARYQTETFRSLILMSHFKVTSVQKWHDQLTGDPLLAGLSGFFDSVPSIGSFYNFMTRIYNQSELSKIQPVDRNQKPKEKLKKGQKWENTPKGKIAALVEEISKNGYPQQDRVILEIFAQTAVRPSARIGIIDFNNIILSGDGTAIHEHASSWGHSIKGDDQHRRYSDPDADNGWDSDLGSYYFGYHGYFNCVHNSGLKVDLPVFMELNPASVHDSRPGVSTLLGFKELYPEAKLEAVCLDSAHDNEATYALIESLGAKPFIDPNNRSKRKSTNNKEYMDDAGNMICSAGLVMHNAGWDKTNKCIRYQCPCKFKRSGVKECPLGSPCSDRPKGRVINYFPDSLRGKYKALHSRSEWKTTYKNRTSCERVNNRILNDYKLHQSKARGRKHLLIQILLGFINIHADAWLKLESTAKIA